MKYKILTGKDFGELHKLLVDWDFPKTPNNKEEFYNVVKDAIVIGIIEDDNLEAVMLLFNAEINDKTIMIDICASDKFKGNWATKKLFRIGCAIAIKQGKTHFGVEAVNPIAVIAAKKAGFKYIDGTLYLVKVNEFKKKWRV